MMKTVLAAAMVLAGVSALPAMAADYKIERPQGELSSLGAYEVPVAFACPLNPALTNLEVCLGVASREVLNVRRGEFIRDEDDYLQAEADYASVRGALEELIVLIDAMDQTVVGDQGARVRRLIGLMGKVRKDIDNSYNRLYTPVIKPYAVG